MNSQIFKISILNLKSLSVCKYKFSSLQLSRENWELHGFSNHAVLQVTFLWIYFIADVNPLIIENVPDNLQSSPMNKTLPGNLNKCI